MFYKKSKAFTKRFEKMSWGLKKVSGKKCHRVENVWGQKMFQHRMPGHSPWPGSHESSSVHNFVLHKSKKYGKKDALSL